METELTYVIILGVVSLAFVGEYVDSTLIKNR